MTRELLEAFIAQKKSVLCVGLDPDVDKLPMPFQRRHKA